MEINNLLNKIDKILFESSKEMNNPVIDSDLGALIYFATRYKISNETKYKEHCEVLLNKFISVFSDFNYSTGTLTGFESVFWVISYLEESNLIEDSNLFLEDIEENLFLSVENDIEDNFNEIFYGTIGKVQFLLNDKKIKETKVINLINKIINSLWITKKKLNNQIYWSDKEYEEEHLGYVDLGIAHGICAILLFLVKLKELKFENEYIDTLIYGIIETFTLAESNQRGVSSFPDTYCIKNKDLNMINSRLGFCVGDLPAAYAIGYAGEIFKKEEWQLFSKKIIKKSAYRDISDSQLVYFSDYDFFDIGFCHGMSSILYIYYRVNKWVKDDYISFKIKYWEKELIKNVNKFIEIKDPIYYSKTSSKDKDKLELKKYSFLDGLCGASLALLAIEYDQISWSKFLSLY